MLTTKETTRPIRWWSYGMRHTLYSVYDIGLVPSTITYDSGEKFVGKGEMTIIVFTDSTYTLLVEHIRMQLI